MKEIRISEKLKKVCPQTTLGCIQGKVVVVNENKELWEKVSDECEKRIHTIKELSQITQIKNIQDARAVYRKLGHDPTRYRLSSESLLRRIIKGKGLYQVNNIVDINNLISILSYYPVCTYDAEKIYDPIYFTIGEKGEVYEGIGRGVIPIENLPVFSDKEGKFGSTTSDSERAKVTNFTRNILMIIVSFNGIQQMRTYLEQAKNLLKDYGNAENIEIKIVE